MGLVIFGHERQNNRLAAILDIVVCAIASSMDGLENSNQACLKAY